MFDEIDACQLLDLEFFAIPLDDGLDDLWVVIEPGRDSFGDFPDPFFREFPGRVLNRIEAESLESPSRLLRHFERILVVDSHRGFVCWLQDGACEALTHLYTLVVYGHRPGWAVNRLDCARAHVLPCADVAFSPSGYRQHCLERLACGVAHLNPLWPHDHSRGTGSRDFGSDPSF